MVKKKVNGLHFEVNFVSAITFKLRGDDKNKNSLFKDIVQIEVDPLPPTLILTNLFLTKC